MLGSSFLRRDSYSSACFLASFYFKNDSTPHFGVGLRNKRMSVNPVLPQNLTHIRCSVSGTIDRIVQASGKTI